MGDLEGAPSVHFNFPLLSFSLYITFKSGLPLPVSLFLWNRGGLVNEILSISVIPGHRTHTHCMCVALL